VEVTKIVEYFTSQMTKFHYAKKKKKKTLIKKKKKKRPLLNNNNNNFNLTTMNLTQGEGMV